MQKFDFLPQINSPMFLENRRMDMPKLGRFFQEKLHKYQQNT